MKRRNCIKILTLASLSGCVGPYEVENENKNPNLEVVSHDSEQGLAGAFSGEVTIDFDVRNRVDVEGRGRLTVEVVDSNGRVVNTERESFYIGPNGVRDIEMQVETNGGSRYNYRVEPIG
jgi:hypothetical protein